MRLASVRRLLLLLLLHLLLYLLLRRLLLCLLLSSLELLLHVAALIYSLALHIVPSANVVLSPQWSVSFEC